MLLFINAKLSIHVPGSSNSYRTDKAQPQRGELTLYYKYVLDLMMSINLFGNMFIIKSNDNNKIENMIPFRKKLDIRTTNLNTKWNRILDLLV